MNEPIRKLERLITREDIQRMMEAARTLDISKGGAFDARLGAINFWCAPDDKPSCWNKKISGGLVLRDFVGTVTFDEVGEDLYQLSLCATPYELLDDSQSIRWDRIPSENYDAIFNWLEIKIGQLLELVNI